VYKQGRKSALQRGPGCSHQPAVADSNSLMSRCAMPCCAVLCPAGHDRSARYVIHAVNRVAEIFLSYNNGTVVANALGDTRISLQAIMGVANVAAASGLVASEPVSSIFCGTSSCCAAYTLQLLRYVHMLEVCVGGSVAAAGQTALRAAYAQNLAMGCLGQCSVVQESSQWHLDVHSSSSLARPLASLLPFVSSPPAALPFLHPGSSPCSSPCRPATTTLPAGVTCLSGWPQHQPRTQSPCCSLPCRLAPTQWPSGWSRL
jgi:hypothetical protein